MSARGRIERLESKMGAREPAPLTPMGADSIEAVLEMFRARDEDRRPERWAVDHCREMRARIG